jgi:WD40 repeat protein/beta-lactamase regulating signal transducer with metallopeptidase domain/uncharacterized GH25 family protein/glutathione peroxidase-family protein
MLDFWTDRVGWVLVHSLWQFALAALLAIVLQRALRRRSATTRYAALLGVMAVMVAAPAATWFSPWSTDSPAVTAQLTPIEKPQEAPPLQQTALPEHAEAPVEMATLPVQPAVELAPQPQPEPPRPESSAIDLTAFWSTVKSHVQPWLPEIVLAWLVGVLLAALRPLLSWYTVRRLRTVGVSPVADAVQDVLERTAKRLRLARAVDVLQSTLVKAPVVVGYFRPAVLLPLCVATGMPPAQLEAILAHELAHIRRHDYLVNLLQTLVETLFFYHPAVWWLSRQIRNERENCCDDVAIAAVDSRADYGRALLAIEELRAASPAISLAARGGMLLARIRRIAGYEPVPHVAGGASILCGILASLAFFAALTWGAGEPLAQTDKLDVSEDVLPKGAVLRLGTVRLHHRCSPNCIVFSPDGQTIASSAVNQDMGVSLWEANTGKLLRRLNDPELKRGWTEGIAFSPDGTKLVSARIDGEVLLTEVKSGRILLKKTHGRETKAVAFSPDGTQFASGGNGKVHVWSAANGDEIKILDSGTQLPATLGDRMGTWGIAAIAFSPKDKLLAAATGRPDATIYVWNLETGKIVTKIEKAHGEEVLSLAFTGDGNQLISSGYRRVPRSEFGKAFHAKTVQVPEIRLWDATTGSRVRELATNEPEAGFGISALSGNGKILVSAADEKIRVWDLASGKTTRAIPNPGGSSSLGLAISPDGRTIAAAKDYTIGLWDANTGKPILQNVDSHSKSTVFVAYSPDGELVLTGSHDGRVVAWDAKTGNRRYQRELGPHPSVMAMALSADGRRLAAGGRADWPRSGANVVHVWDAKTGKPVRNFGENDYRFDDVRRLAFSADGKRLAIAADIRRANSGDVDIWEVDTGKKVLEIRPEKGGFNTYAMAFSPESSALLEVFGQPAELHVWDAQTGKLRRTFAPHLAAQEPHNAGNRELYISGAILSPDGRWLITSQARMLVVWDVATGKAVSRVETPGTDKGRFLGISRDGRWLAAAEVLYATDWGTGAVALCNLDATTGDIRRCQPGSGQTAHAVESGDGRVMSFAFSPDNTRLATGMDGCTTLLWDLKSVSDAVTWAAASSAEKSEQPTATAETFRKLSDAEQRATLVKAFERRPQQGKNLFYETEQVYRAFKSDSWQPGKPVTQYPSYIRYHYRYWQLGDSYKMETRQYDDPKTVDFYRYSANAENAQEGVGRNVTISKGQSPISQGQVVYPNARSIDKRFAFVPSPDDLSATSGNPQYFFQYLIAKKDRYEIKSSDAGDGIQLLIPWRTTKQVLLLDPQKDFLPIRHTTRWEIPRTKDQEGYWSETQFEVQESRLCDKVWMPVKMVSKSLSSLNILTVVETNILRMESGNVKPADLLLPFTEGMQVADIIEGATYTADAQGNAVDAKDSQNWKHDPPKGWHRGRVEETYSMLSKISTAERKRLVDERDAKWKPIDEGLKVLRAHPPAAQEERIEAALKILRVYRPGEREDDWAVAIRELITIGKPAVPRLIEELDRTNRDATLRAMGFVLRGIGDPRAAPALIRAIPRLIQPPSSDFGLTIKKDPDLLKFMWMNDRDHVGNNKGIRKTNGLVLFSYGRPIREIMPALEKLTGQSLGWQALGSADMKADGTVQLRRQRTLFVDHANKWADWWSHNWKSFVPEEADAQLDRTKKSVEEAAKLIAGMPQASAPTEIPCGPLVKLAEGCSHHQFEPYLNLDVGRGIASPEELLKNSPKDHPSPELSAWAAQNGVDLLRVEIKRPGDSKTYYGYQPVGMKVWKIDNKRLKNLEKELQGSKKLDIPPPWTGPISSVDQREGDLPVEEPATFLFITREGTCGVMQIRSALFHEFIEGSPVMGPPVFEYRYIYKSEPKEPSAKETIVPAQPQSSTPGKEASVPSSKTETTGKLAATVKKNGTFAVEGTVTTADGKPFADATVGIYITKFPGSAFPRTKTDGNGHYRFQIDDPGDYIVAAAADGVVPSWKTIAVDKDRQTVDLQLHKGEPVRVRVVDPQGKPMPAVRVSFAVAASDKNAGLLFLDHERERKHWLRDTDAEGRWSTNWIPKDQLRLFAAREGYVRANMRLTPDASETVITLEPAICISGRVVDRETGAPVKKFRVTDGWQSNPHDEMTWSHTQTVENPNGEYRIWFDTPSRDRGLCIEADGYLPSPVQRLRNDEKQKTWNVELVKGESITGIVRSPAGAPLSDVEVALCTAKRGCRLYNGRIAAPPNHYPLMVRTQADGRFSFPPQTDPYVLLATHDLGFALTGDETKSRDMTLHPWAKVEGTVTIDGKPGARERVSLKYANAPAQSPSSWQQPAARLIVRTFDLSTDRDGRFVWDRALPGKATISRKVPLSKDDWDSPSTDANTRSVELFSGRTLAVAINDSAPPVIQEREDHSKQSQSTGPVAWQPRPVLGAKPIAAAQAKGKDVKLPSSNTDANTWKPGQTLDLRIINAKTKEPLSDVKLKISFSSGEGSSFRREESTQTTNAQGNSEIKLPAWRPDAVRVYPSKAGFVPLRVYWDGNTTPALIPKSTTVPLEPGTDLGGVVQDEQGKPIPGVTVTVHYWETPFENPHLRANIDETATTDKDGHWRVNIMPAKIVEDDLRIFLTHSDYVSDHTEDAISLPITERPAMEALRGQTAVMVMRKGESVNGRVVDEKGKPIPGASIYYKELSAVDRPGSPVVTSDASGRFQIPNIKPSEDASRRGRRFPSRYDDSAKTILTVQARGYTPAMLEADRSPPGKPLEISLKPGQAIQGRVVDENGKPVAGVSIWVSRWQNRSGRLCLTATTDADGRFHLNDAPLSDITYTFRKEGYMMLEDFPMSPGTKEQEKRSYTVTLQSPLRVAGSIVDSETNTPLSKCTIMTGWEYEDGRAPEWQRLVSAKRITNGRYEFDFMQKLFAHRIRVEAEGYMPAVSRVFKPANGDKGRVTCDFKLRKAPPLTGTVVDSTGRPLVDAEVYLATNLLVVNDRKPWSQTLMNARMARTDAAGRFELPPEIEPFYLVVLHDQGYAVTAEKQFAQTPTIRIEPWTAENQSFRAERSPSSHLGESLPADASNALAVRVVDVDGKPVEGAHVATSTNFQVLPNHFVPYDSGWTYSLNILSDRDGMARIANQHGINCVVARHVERKLVALQSISPEQMKQRNTVTMTMYPECKVFGKLTAKEMEARNRKIAFSNVYLHMNDGMGRPMSCISGMTGFHFYAPPGTYRLNAYGTDTQHVWKTITVKPGQKELEVEPIDLPPTGLVLLEGKPAPELREIMAWKNGGPIKLSDLRGKVIILAFSSGWDARGSIMPELLPLYDKYHDQGLVIIEIRYDFGQRNDSEAKRNEKLAEVKPPFWKDHGDIPVPIALVLRNRAPSQPDAKTKWACPLLEDYGINGIPTGILIDRQGRVVGRFDPRTDRDAAARDAVLEKVLKEK